jgi:hypothetical protein
VVYTRVSVAAVSSGVVIVGTDRLRFKDIEQ